VLTVTITPDRFVDKGPDRPAFPELLRAESLAALECVDYVGINEWPTAEETLKVLRPDFFVKGQEFEHLEDKTGKIQREYTVAHELGVELRFTHEIVYSSTQLIHKYLK
jgi:bifunctional ADP-heptose synthase (sugar kinase/adenylyltransferase)